MLHFPEYFQIHDISKASKGAIMEDRVKRKCVLNLFFVFFNCCLTSQSTAMVMGGRSVHLTKLFLDKLEQAVNQYFVHILMLVTDNNPS